MSSLAPPLPPKSPLKQRLTAEALGTAFLLMAVVGSGIMAAQLSHGNTALALLANAIATGAALVVLIAVFAPVSGAHFNPVVSLSAAALGTMPWREVPSFIAAQVTGAMAGVWLSHLMFEKPLLMLAQTPRTGSGQHLAEAIATFGLLLVIWASARRRADAVAWMVGLYITAAYWFSSSTAFANPAVTLARCFSDTFAGIRPQDAPWFVSAQLLGTALSIPLIKWLFPGNSPPSPHT